MKKTRLYARFLLINLDKCREVQRVLNPAQTPSTMCRNYFPRGQNATLQFSHVAVPV